MNNTHQAVLRNVLKTVLFITVISVCAYLSGQYYFQSDWTANKRNTLSDDSRKLLQQLEHPVSITAFVKTNAQLKKNIDALIDQYRQYKHDISLKYVDPALNPQYINALNLNPEGEILVEYNQGKEKLPSLTEHSLSNALLRLSGSKDRWIVFLQGHGERQPDRPGNQDLEQFASLLTGRGMHVQTLDLGQTGAIPDNTSTLIIAGPRLDIPDDETGIIFEYLNKGGNLLWLADPDNQHFTDPLAGHLGLEILPGTIISAKTPLLGIKNPAIIVINQYANKHVLTNGIEQATLFPFACGIRAKTNDNWSAKPILSSSEKSWTETGDLQQHPLRFNQDSNELRGPINIGMALTGIKNPQRIVVICDGDFLSNAFLLNGSNRALGNNLIHWLGHDEKFININPPVATDSYLQLDGFASAIVRFVFPFLIPALLVITGIVIRYRRER